MYCRVSVRTWLCWPLSNPLYIGSEWWTKITAVWQDLGKQFMCIYYIVCTVYVCHFSMRMWLCWPLSNPLTIGRECGEQLSDDNHVLRPHTMHGKRPSCSRGGIHSCREKQNFLLYSEHFINEQGLLQCPPLCNITPPYRPSGKSAVHLELPTYAWKIPPLEGRGRCSAVKATILCCSVTYVVTHKSCYCCEQSYLWEEKLRLKF
jgi:hypothetical protein